jgi:hypothetical protein
MFSHLLPPPPKHPLTATKTKESKGQDDVESTGFEWREKAENLNTSMPRNIGERMYVVMRELG